MNTQLMKKFGGRRLVGISAFVAATAFAWAVLTSVALAGPTNTGLPSIAPVGTPHDGQTLTGTQGTWSGTPTISDQWESCSGGTCSPVGATGNLSYVVQPTDVGHTILLRETATDATLVPPSMTVDSLATPAVAANPPANSAAPTVGGVVGGVVQPGQILTASAGTWTGTPPITLSYQWSVGGAAVGTNSPLNTKYTVTASDVGKAIAVAVTATNAGGGPVGPVSSVAVGPVLPLAPSNLTPPTISGTPQQGQTLTMTSGTWSNNPTLTNVWEDCSGLTCTAIPGQTGLTYTVGAADVGHTIQVVQTASNAAPPPTNVLAVPSARTATVSAISATSVLAYSQNTPTTNQAITLVAAVTSGSGNANPRGSLSFFNGSNAIPGCANKSVNGGQTVTIVCQASLGAGQAQISAAYVPDPTSLVAGSTSDTTSVDVGQGSTSISLAVTPKVAPRGRATYLATLGVPLSNAGPVLPTGSIEFLDGGQPIATCASQPLTNLTATCSMRYTVAGVHSITARYKGDSNFTGSTSPGSGVQVVKGAPKAPAVRGALGATMGWTIYYRRHYSWVSALTAFAVPKGTTIIVLCTGKGCPFGERRLTNVAGTVSLQGLFHRRHLRAGTRITVRLTRKHWIGKAYSFTIRGGQKPTIKKVCLAPGSTLHIVPCPAT